MAMQGDDNKDTVEKITKLLQSKKSQFRHLTNNIIPHLSRHFEPQPFTSI
jgi:hypothetical protein